jgi:hypothetical protein
MDKMNMLPPEAIKLLNLYQAVYGSPSPGKKEIKEKLNKRDVENNQ